VPSRLKFAIKVDDYLPDLDGEPAVEPVFGLSGFWIMEEQSTEAEMLGYEILTPSSMICTHVQQAIVKSLPMMVDLDDIEKMVNRLQTVKPKLVEAALSQSGSLTTLLRVVRELLREKVPVTQLSVILETMAEMSEVTLTFSDLLMHIRKRLAPWILDSIVPDSKEVQVITFSDQLQDEMYKALRPDGSVGLDPKRINELDAEIKGAAKNLDDFDYPAILLVNPMLRRAIFDLFGEQTEGLYVLDFFSFPKTTKINRATTIG
jgi:flagellar biosynthesis protein FlhA